MNIWDKIYKKKLHASIWPWNEVIKSTNLFIKKKNCKVLELGCGMGANIPFFLKKQFKYTGLDYSKVSVSFLKKKFPQLKKNIHCIDIEKEELPFKNFDLIVDRGCLVHIDKKKLINIVERLRLSLISGGIMISTDLISNKSSDYKLFKDLRTNNNFNPIKLKKIYKKWKIISLTKEAKTNLLKKKKNIFYNIVIKK